MKTWGVYDQVDKVWMGTDTGPHRYTTGIMGPKKVTVSGKEKAQLSATIHAEAMGQVGRYRAKEIPANITKKRDTVQARITPREAIARIEGFNDGT